MSDLSSRSTQGELTFKGGWAGVKVAPQRERHHSGRGAVLPFNQPEDTVGSRPTPRGGRARPEPPISDMRAERVVSSAGRTSFLIVNNIFYPGPRYVYRESERWCAVTNFIWSNGQKRQKLLEERAVPSVQT